MLGMVVLSTAAEDEPKKAEVNVRAILRAEKATDLAAEVAKQMDLKQSAKSSNGFNDLERPSVDFRAFTVSFTIDNTSGNRKASITTSGRCSCLRIAYDVRFCGKYNG